MNSFSLIPSSFIVSRRRRGSDSVRFKERKKLLRLWHFFFLLFTCSRLLSSETPSVISGIQFDFLPELTFLIFFLSLPLIFPLLSSLSSNSPLFCFPLSSYPPYVFLFLRHSLPFPTFSRFPLFSSYSTSPYPFSSLSSTSSYPSYSSPSFSSSLLLF